MLSTIISLFILVGIGIAGFMGIAHRKSAVPGPPSPPSGVHLPDTGPSAPRETPKIAARCSGCPDRHCTARFICSGLDNCHRAAQMAADEGGCEYACLGLGNCQRRCPFGALGMDENRLPVVDDKKCTGCGLCSTVCPRNIIQILPGLAAKIIRCKNEEENGAAKKEYQSSCMGCKACEASCPHGAMTVIDNQCEIDYKKCRECTEPACLVIQCKPKVLHPAGCDSLNPPPVLAPDPTH